MITPQKPSPQATNKSLEDEAKLAWYRVPIIWLGIFLTLLVFLGLLHMSYVSHQSVKGYIEADTKPQKTKNEITHFRGMPLSRPESTPTTSEQQKNHHD